MTIDAHPNASRKYFNTATLKAKAIALSEDVDGLKMGARERKRLRSTIKLLSLKESVLMYLEEMTQGRIHGGLDQDEIRDICDWVTHDTAINPPPSQMSKYAYSALRQLRGYIESSQSPKYAKAEVSKLLYTESRPELDLDEVENLVLAGGGAKAFSLAGSIEALERSGRSEQIQRVAGTSGGAILAMAYAAGYNAEEVKNLILENNYGLFTLESSASNGLMNALAHKFGRKSKENRLSALSDNKMTIFYHKALMVRLCEAILNSDHPSLAKLQGYIASCGTPTRQVARLLKAVKQNSEPESYIRGITEILEEPIIKLEYLARKDTVARFKDSINGKFIHFYTTPQKAVQSAVRHQAGRDVILGFFQDVIFEKLKNLPKASLQKAFGKALVTENDLREINFTQWQKLHKDNPGKMRELHISICYHEGLRDIIHQDAAYNNPEFASMSVAEAVRVSMNLPAVFPKYKFKVNGNEYKGIDGGVVSNVSFDSFDKDHPVKTTIGLFFRTESELAKAHDLGTILAPPRSIKALEKEVVDQQSIYSLNQAVLKSHQDEYETLTPEEKKGKAGNDLLVAINRRSIMAREAGGRMDAIKQDLERAMMQPSEFSKLTESPLSYSLGLAKKGYSKIYKLSSVNNISKTHNRNRLVMINTQDVDMPHFKLTNREKLNQIALGGVAMGSLLKGSYCLENHFHFHQLEIAAKSLGDKNPSLSKFGTPERSRPYEEYEPHIYEGSSRFDDLDVMSEMEQHRESKKERTPDEKMEMHRQFVRELDEERRSFRR